MVTSPTFTNEVLAALDAPADSAPDGRPAAAVLSALQRGLESRLGGTPWFERYRWTDEFRTPYIGPASPGESGYAWLGLVDEAYRSLPRASRALQIEFGVDGGSATGFLGREVLWGVLLGPWADDDVVDEVRGNLRNNSDTFARFLRDTDEYLLVTKTETLRSPDASAVEALADDIDGGLALTLDRTLDDLPSMEAVEAACRSLEDLVPLYRLLAGIEDAPPVEVPSAGSEPVRREADESTETAEGSGTGAGGDERPPATDKYPPEMVERDQWLLWKPTDDGRKVPRAPWSTGDPLRFVDAMDPDHWASFEEATEWAEKLPRDLHLAFCLTRDDDVVFVDLDDVVVDGALTESAERLVADADSYAAYSTSGTGVHVFLRGSLSEDVKSITGPLGEDGAEGSVEVYDRNRFVATTGDRLDVTPRAVRARPSLLRDLEETHATVRSATPDRATAEPTRSRGELREMETTADIQDVFDAIKQTRPSDIRMRSTRTREHGDGTYSYDPSWVHSESGTRLGVLDDVWIYRKGMIALDALQVVALEEGIITDERTYPEGERFWRAVEALRDRGAAIPTYEPEGGDVDAESETETGTEADDTLDTWEVARALNYGERVRGYVHPYDRDYQEDLALELAPTLVSATEDLRLPPAVGYRSAELYATAHAAGIVPGASHETTLGAAIRLAGILEGHPRPLDAISDVLDEDPGTVRRKFHRIVAETDVGDRISAGALDVPPEEYVPYLAMRLGVEEDTALQERVRELLSTVEWTGSTNPMSEVGSAFYVAATEDGDHDVTQRDVADAAGVSVVTIRNNYGKYT